MYKQNMNILFFTILVPPVISMLNPGRNITVRKGSTVKLVCNATGFPKPEIVWERQVSNFTKYLHQNIARLTLYIYIYIYIYIYLIYKFR